MRRLPPSLLAVAALALVCGPAVAFGAAGSPSPVLNAPAGTAAQAAADALAVLSQLRLPAGSRRLSAPPHGLVAALQEPGSLYGYVTFKRASGYWTVPSAAAALRLLSERPAGDSTQFSWGEDSSGPQGVQWKLPTADPWLGPRWIEVAAVADPHTSGRWFVMATAVVVWTPYRLDLPSTAASVTVRRLQDRAVLATVSDAARIAQIVAAVNGLAVDDAIHAVYSCPMLQVGKRPGFELTFADASGNVLATATTDWCPLDLSLKVGTHGPQQLILGGLVAKLERILGITLPPAF
jgi:hypothetical protein